MVRLSKTSNMVSKRQENFILKRWYVHVVEKLKQYKKVLVHVVNESFLFLAPSASDVTTLTSFLCSLPEIFCVCVCVCVHILLYLFLKQVETDYKHCSKGPRDYHIKWNKSYREGQISYDIPYFSQFNCSVMSNSLQPYGL